MNQGELAVIIACVVLLGMLSNRSLSWIVASVVIILSLLALAITTIAALQPH